MRSVMRLFLAWFVLDLARAARLRSAPTTKQVVGENQTEPATEDPEADLSLLIAPSDAIVLNAKPPADAAGAVAHSPAPASRQYPRAVLITIVADPKVPSKEAVAKLHEKLTTLAASLQGMLEARNGTLSHAEIGPPMQAFLKALNSTLVETKDPEDTAAAMRKLEDAKAGLGGLTKALADQQSNLMLENEAQGSSYLLGELMTKQSLPMEEQLKLLKVDDFANLEVSKALLANHEKTRALYTQAAEYLDKHGSKRSIQLANKRKAAYEHINTMTVSLDKRVKALEREQELGEQAHKKKVAALDQAMKKASKSEAHKMELIKKRGERNYKKQEALRKHDIESMKAAVEAVKTGDTKALAHAQAALATSVKAMQAQGGGFLHFLQLGHKLMHRDCPYCVAQCLEKCHAVGTPYVQCMGDCAEVGK